MPKSNISNQTINVKSKKPFKRKDELNSAFGVNFHYNKMPIEVIEVENLSSNDRTILARILYWTRKGMPCSHTNRQFGLLIERSERTAERCVAMLIKRKLVDAQYKNDGKAHRRGAHRDLTALVGVDAEMVLKRKAIQITRATQKVKKPRHPCRPDPDILSKKQPKPRHQCPATTNSTKEQLTAASPLPADGQAQTALEINKRQPPHILTSSESNLIERYIADAPGYRHLIDKLRPEIKEKALEREEEQLLLARWTLYDPDYMPEVAKCG